MKKLPTAVDSDKAIPKTVWSPVSRTAEDLFDASSDIDEPSIIEQLEGVNVLLEEVTVREDRVHNDLQETFASRTELLATVDLLDAFAQAQPGALLWKDEGTELYSSILPSAQIEEYAAELRADLATGADELAFITSDISQSEQSPGGKTLTVGQGFAKHALQVYTTMKKETELNESLRELGQFSSALFVKLEVLRSCLDRIGSDMPRSGIGASARSLAGSESTAESDTGIPTLCKALAMKVMEVSALQEVLGALIEERDSREAQRELVADRGDTPVPVDVDSVKRNAEQRFLARIDLDATTSEALQLGACCVDEGYETILQPYLIVEEKEESLKAPTGTYSRRSDNFIISIPKVLGAYIVDVKPPARTQVSPRSTIVDPAVSNNTDWSTGWQDAVWGPATHTRPPSVDAFLGKLEEVMLLRTGRPPTKTCQADREVQRSASTDDEEILTSITHQFPESSVTKEYARKQSIAQASDEALELAKRCLDEGYHAYISHHLIIDGAKVSLRSGSAAPRAAPVVRRLNLLASMGHPPDGQQASAVTQSGCAT